MQLAHWISTTPGPVANQRFSQPGSALLVRGLPEPMKHFLLNCSPLSSWIGSYFAARRIRCTAEPEVIAVPRLLSSQRQRLRYSKRLETVS